MILTWEHDLHLQARPGEWLLSQSALHALLRGKVETACHPSAPGPGSIQLPYFQQDVPSQAAPATKHQLQLGPGWSPVEYGSGFGQHAIAQTFEAASRQHSRIISDDQPADSAPCLPESCMPQPAYSDPASELRQFVADPPGGSFGSNATGQNPGSSTQPSGAPQSFMQQRLTSPTASAAFWATPPSFSQHFPSQAYVLDAAQGTPQGPIGSETSAQAVPLHTGLPAPTASTGMTLSNAMHAQTPAGSTWLPGPWTSPTRQMHADRAYLPGNFSTAFSMY